MVRMKKYQTSEFSNSAPWRSRDHNANDIFGGAMGFQLTCRKKI